MELQETSCHNLEATRLDDIFNKTFVNRLHYSIENKHVTSNGIYNQFGAINFPFLLLQSILRPVFSGCGANQLHRFLIRYMVKNLHAVCRFSCC